MRQHTVILVPDAAGQFSVLVPTMPGCVTAGQTRTDALTHAREAMLGWMAAEAAQHREPLPETASVVEDGVRDAVQIVDAMRAAGELPPGQGYNLELVTVELPSHVLA